MIKLGDSMNINLDGFCEVQKIVWEQFKKRVEENCKCLKCGSSLKMTSKFRAECIECHQKHTIKKPKNFPKNMDDKRNWKSTCCECGGTMDYYENRSGGAYICRKCSNILEV